MSQAANVDAFIQITHARWGQVPNSHVQSAWRVNKDGSVWFDNRVQQKETGDDQVTSWKIAADGRRFALIESLLKPLQAFIGKKCQSYPTVASQWQVQWAAEKRMFTLHSACLDAWAEQAYRLMDAANNQVIQWMQQTHTDFNSGYMRLGK